MANTPKTRPTGIAALLAATGLLALVPSPAQACSCPDPKGMVVQADDPRSETHWAEEAYRSSDWPTVPEKIGLWAQTEDLTFWITPADIAPIDPFALEYTIAPDQQPDRAQTLTLVAATQVAYSYDSWVITLRPASALDAGRYWVSFAGDVALPVQIKSTEVHSFTELPVPTVEVWTTARDDHGFCVAFGNTWFELTWPDLDPSRLPPLVKLEVRVNGVWRNWGTYSPRTGHIRSGTRSICDWDLPSYSERHDEMATELRLSDHNRPQAVGSVVVDLRALTRQEYYSSPFDTEPRSDAPASSGETWLHRLRRRLRGPRPLDARRGHCR